MAELLLGALLPVLLERLVAPALLNFANREKVGDLVKKWNTKLKTISKLVEDAEDKARVDEAVQLWLDDLRDLIYDIEDVVDEFVTEERIRSLSKEAVAVAVAAAATVGCGSSITRKVRSLFPSCCADLSPRKVMLDHDLRSKMEKIGVRLDSLLEQKKDLELIERGGSSMKSSYSNSDRMTDSLPKRYVVGREQDESAILAKLLTETDDQHLSVIPIFGLGGVGKTTLAQSVFNNPAVIEAFPKRGWACVSDNFNMIEIARALLGSLGGISVGATDDLNVLHNKIREILAKEKFLIVLDDYWNVNYNDWERLYNLYNLGVKGSKVIVTTRNQDIASMMTNNRSTFRLRELSSNDCLSLLAYHALGVDNFDAHPHFKLLGEEIAAKCKGLPLAAKTLGGLLRSESDTREWENIRDSKIWNLPQGKDDILLALKLSYIHLPPHLKRCFVFCAIFPQDYEFDRDELVLLWMAEGLVDTKCADSRRGMVYQGKKQFDELLNRSFFQRSTQDESLFVMHDLMHDLATSIGGNTCLNVNANKIEDVQYNKSPEKIRHLFDFSISNEADGKFEKCHVLKGLRTFIALGNWGNLSYNALEESLQNLKYLRAFSLNFLRDIGKIPNCIGHLMHLRYLNFFNSYNLKELPESICTLYNLETLILRGCIKITELPSGMDKLINLKCLDIRHTNSLKKMPVELGRLHNLEILTKFIVGREEDGLRLKVLRHWQYLQGEFSILDLQNVEDVGDARDADLSGKVGLTTLTLTWVSGSSCSQNVDKEQQVLEHLEPHQTIKEVKIDGYGGTRFPLWIGDPSMANMTKVRLESCKNVTILPSFGIITCLRELWIEGMDAVRAVGSEFYGDVETPFPSLEVLKFKRMLTWEIWSSSSSGGEKEIEEPFPRLIKLELESCPVLVSNLPHRLCSVVELTIEECPLLKASPCMASSLKDLYLQGCDHDLLAMMISSTSQNAPIKRISLHRIQKLTYLNEDTLSGAECLEIRKCDELISFLEENVISEAAVVARSLNRLEYLCIEECANLEKLPNNMQKLMSLEGLRIQHCSKLESLSEGGLPLSIEELTIAYCPKLKQPLEELGLHRLTALKKLNIEGEIGSLCHHQQEGNIIRTSCFPPLPTDWMFFPSNLEVLSIWYQCDMVRLLNGLRNHLTSLRELELQYCPKLQFLPDEGFPPSLESLIIGGCSQDMLNKCSKNGDYFPLIASIPRVFIF